MARYWQLLVKARGETKPAQRAMRDLRKSSRDLQRAIGIDFRSVARNSAIALGAGLAATVKVGIDELREARVVSSQLDTALRNNGQNAGVTRDAIDKLATSLSYKAAVDDELIASAAAQTLAFRNVRNEAGRGNDIFTRLQKASLDYSSATNSDLVQSQMKFARALNEPAKASKLLRGAGIALTKAQQDQLKTFTDSGNTLGAQRFILSQLESRYKGAAAAAGNAKPWERLKIVFANLAGTLVGSVGTGFGSFLNKLSAGIVKLDKFFQSAKGQNVLAQVGAALSKLGSVLVSTFRVAVSFGQTLYRWRDVLVPITGVILAMFAAWRAYKILKAAKVAFIALNAAMRANPIGLIITAITGVIALFIILYKRSATFRGIVDLVVARFKTFGAAAGNVLRSIWQKMQPVVSILKTIATIYIKMVITYFKTMWSVVTVVFRAVWSVAQPVIGVLKTIATIYIKMVITYFKTLWNIARVVFRGIWAAVRPVINVIRSLASIYIRNVVNGFNMLKGAAQTAWSIISGAWSRASGLFAKVRNALNFSSAFDGIKNGFKSAINAVIGLWNDLEFKIPSLKIAGKKIFGGASIGTPNIPLLAAGGNVMSAGAAIIGEAGPELLELPRGARVTPLGRSAGNTYNVTVNTQERVDTIAFMRSLRVAARMGTI